MGYLNNLHDDANNDRFSRSSWSSTSKIKCWSYQNIQTYQWGTIFSYSIQFFFSFVLLDDLEMRKTITIISLYLRVFVLFFSHTYTTLWCNNLTSEAFFLFLTLIFEGSFFVCRFWDRGQKTYHAIRTNTLYRMDKIIDQFLFNPYNIVSEYYFSFSFRFIMQKRKNVVIIK
jgi:hypothetical protein